MENLLNINSLKYIATRLSAPIAATVGLISGIGIMYFFILPFCQRRMSSAISAQSMSLEDAAADPRTVYNIALLPASAAPDANDMSGMSPQLKELGEELEKAFHDKSNPSRIKELVAQGAPVNYRLNYGLEIALEADFVAALRLILEGNKGDGVLLKNTTRLYTSSEAAEKLKQYVETAQEIYDYLKSPQANPILIPLNKKFEQHLINYPQNSRFDPEQKNGALIIAAGIRDQKLLNEVLIEDRQSDREENGAAVNFKGFFDETAAVWSAILLDRPNLEILLDNGAQMEKIGLHQSSLLHWVVVAARLDNSPERQEKALSCAELLLSREGIDIRSPNKLGYSALHYARGDMLDLLASSLV